MKFVSIFIASYFFVFNICSVYPLAPKSGVYESLKGDKIDNYLPLPPLRSHQFDGKYRPQWLLQQTIVSVFLRQSNFSVKDSDIVSKMTVALNAMGMPTNENEIRFVLNQLVDLGIITVNNQSTWNILLTPYVLAVWADDYQYIKNELIQSLESNDTNALLYQLRIFSSVTELQPRFPLESRYPVLRGVAVLDKGHQEQLLQFIESIKESHPEIYNQPLVDSIRLMLVEAVDSSEWMKRNAANLIGRTIYEISPEVSDVRGGLGRVEQYHTSAMKELGANVAFVEPYYLTRPKPNGEIEPADYTKVGVPLSDIKPVQNLEGEPLTFFIPMSDQTNLVEVEVFQGTNELGIPSYLIRDKGGVYTKMLYQYDTSRGYVSNDVFTEFFTKAAWRFAFINEFNRKKKMEASGETYKPGMLNVNDGQSVMTTLWAVVNYYEALNENKEELAEFIETLFLSATTHTYKNRGFFGNDYEGYWKDRLIQMGIPVSLHWVFLSKSKRDESAEPSYNIDFTSAGLNAAHYQKAVAAIHATEMARNNPLISLVGVTNGDNRKFSTVVFREVLEQVTRERSESYDPDRPTKEQIMEVKKRIKKRLQDTLNQKRQTLGRDKLLEPVVLRDDQPVFSYSGRWVPEKASPRALIPENILEVVKAGGQIVVYGNVQPYAASIRIGDRMLSLEKQINDLKKSNPSLYPGNFIFMPNFTLKEQIELLAASDVQIQDSDRYTGAAEYTEADVSANGGLQMSPPYHEGIIANQGRPLNFDDVGNGNTLIPVDSEPQSYLQAMLRIIQMDPVDLATYQATSVRLSRILESRLTGAEYLRQWDKNIQPKHPMAPQKPPKEVFPWKVMLVREGTSGERYTEFLSESEIDVSRGEKIKIILFLNLNDNPEALVQTGIIYHGQTKPMKFVGTYKQNAVYEIELDTDHVGEVELLASSGMWNSLEEFPNIHIVKSVSKSKQFDQENYTVVQDEKQQIVSIRIPKKGSEQIAFHFGIPTKDGWDLNTQGKIQVRQSSGSIENYPLMKDQGDYFEIELVINRDLDLRQLVYSYMRVDESGNQLWSDNDGLDFFIDLTTGSDLSNESNPRSDVLIAA